MYRDESNLTTGLLYVPKTTIGGDRDIGLCVTDVKIHEVDI